MADESKPKKEKKEKAPAAAEATAKPPKKEKAKAEAKPETKAVEKPPEPPRPPADPRMKAFKKFRGRYLPKGPLRDRHKAILTRWTSGEDHGGVTVEELKSLFYDWKTARTKPVKVNA